jgi:hypothetical protein
VAIEATFVLCARSCEDVRNRAKDCGGFIAIVEVCGFNDWFLAMFKEYGCKEVVLIQPWPHHSHAGGRPMKQPAGDEAGSGHDR